MPDDMTPPLSRRALLRRALTPVAGVATATLWPAWAAAADEAATPSAAPASGSAPAHMPVEVRPLEDLGVELVGLRLSGADFLIDLRYRVKDVSKAQALLERKLKPVLVNETTGDRYYIPQTPKVGQLRQSATSKQPAQLDKVYFMLFANPDRKLRAGEKVTLYAGDSVVKGLTVQ